MTVGWRGWLTSSAYSPAADVCWSLTSSSSETLQLCGDFPTVQVEGQEPHLELGFDWTTVVASVCCFRLHLSL